jgi:hypothetical protein
MLFGTSVYSTIIVESDDNRQSQNATQQKESAGIEGIHDGSDEFCNLALCLVRFSSDWDRESRRSLAVRNDSDCDSGIKLTCSDFCSDLISDLDSDEL